jgi:hypothetical protein
MELEKRYGKQEPIMTYRDALFAGAVVALGSAGAIAMAMSGELPYGGREVRAEAIGFDVLAHRVFGDSNCVASVMPESIGRGQVH